MLFHELLSVRVTTTYTWVQFGRYQLHIPETCEEFEISSPDSHSPAPASPSGKNGGGTPKKGRIAASLDRAAASVKTVRRQTGARVAIDLRCSKCGYNQRGLDRASNCPECGNPVMHSLAETAQARDEAESMLEAAHTYGTSHRATIAFGLVPLIGGAGCCCTTLGVVGSAIVLIGCGQRVFALYMMKRKHAQGVPGDLRTFKGAVVTACLELGVGLLYVASLMCGLSSSVAAISPALADYLWPVLTVAWASTLGLGFIASALLADSLARQYSLDVERSRVPLVLAVLPPVLLAIAMGGTLVPGWESIRPLAVLIGGSGLLSLVAWVLAAAAAGAYFTGVLGVLAFVPSRASTALKHDHVVGMQAPETTPEQKAAARRILNDDSPIPLD